MTENKQQIERDLFSDTSAYDDIIDMSRHVSKAHLPMPKEDRAAQFSPFAALTGYHKLLGETAKRYNYKKYLSLNAMRQILTEIEKIENKKPLPKLKVEYFNGQNGYYEVYTGTLEAVDHRRHRLLFTDHTSIVIRAIKSLQIER